MEDLHGRSTEIVPEKGKRESLYWRTAVEDKGQNGNPDLTAMRMMLAELATGQARHEHWWQQHQEGMREIRVTIVEIVSTMADIGKDLAAATRHLRSHARAIEQIDTALDRMDRKLELHGDLIAELIKTKVDRKKRPPRK